mgnify:CR=1 FL=1
MSKTTTYKNLVNTKTKKDKEDLKAAVSMDVDYVALSFACTAADVIQCRELVQAEGSDASIVTKVERAEAIRNIDEIIEDRKSTRLNSSHVALSRMPYAA